MTDEELAEVYAERAAIMEFDGGLPRVKAEALARAEMETYRKAREVRLFECRADWAKRKLESA